MKRIFNWQVTLGIILVLLSAALYYLHYGIFRDSHHIFIYLLGDVAFVPIEVLLVTLIIHRLLTVREKKAMLKKMNMVIGTFFSEAGTELLEIFSDADPSLDKIKEELVIKKDITEKDFKKTAGRLKKYNYTIDWHKADLMNLKDFLLRKRAFLLRLLNNPNLLEHDSFTDLLWAVFHLTEELAHRKDLAGLPETDYDHLAGDIKRAYSALASEWLDYMRHLKNNYPYLFSLAIRTNPFDVSASPVVI